MKRFQILALVAATMLVPVTAGALPMSTSTQPSAAPLIEVQYKRDREWRRDRHRDHDRRHIRRHWDSRGEWRPGHRYDRPPPGWNRYGSRPRDWQRRGCVIVGPVWFCP